MRDDRYGNVRITKIKAAFDELRAACRAEGTPRIQQAIDRYEPWADFAFARPRGDEREPLFESDIIREQEEVIQRIKSRGVRR